jgi:hypothetical protein
MGKTIMAVVGAVVVLAGAAVGTMEIGALAQQAGVGTPLSDGLIQPGEYRHTLLDPTTGMTLHWQNDSTNLYVGLVSPGTGWAGVGFSDHSGKPGSNIILGAVKNGKCTIQDHYGVTKELHLPDWTSSLLATGGTEANGQTTLEFAIPLAGSSSQDVTLVPGQTVAVILAYQATKDSFTAEHTRYAQTTIILDP